MSGHLRVQDGVIIIVHSQNSTKHSHERCSLHKGVTESNTHQFSLASHLSIAHAKPDEVVNGTFQLAGINNAESLSAADIMACRWRLCNLIIYTQN